MSLSTVAEHLDHKFLVRRRESVEALLTHSEFHGKLSDVELDDDVSEAHLEVSIAYFAAARTLQTHEGLRSRPRHWV